MALPPSPRVPDWQATRVPKLAYRKSISQEEADQVRAHARETAIQATNVSRTDPARSSNVRPPTPVEAAAPAKKKNSFLSGLFTKEPTLMALAQVEAELKAKHGAATPQAVPHVSARRLPDHVPKVNSKWDGVPEVVKQRDREEKRRKRLSGQSSLAPHQSMRSRSTESSVRNSAHGHKSWSRRDSDVWAGSVIEPRRSPYRTMGRYHPPSVYTTSSEDSQELHRRPAAASVHSQSLRSPSGTSLPEITSFFPYTEQQPTSALPQSSQGGNSTKTTTTGSSNHSRSEYFRRECYGPTIDVIPEHSSSPITTPREMSPVTPDYACKPAVSPIESLSDTEANARPLVRPMRTVAGQIDAFLAGEARPLHIGDAQKESERDSDLPLRKYQQQRVDWVQPNIAKRPDSSRARLGLSPSMVVRTEAAPWEAQEPSMAGPSSTRLAPKSRLPKALAMFK